MLQSWKLFWVALAALAADSSRSEAGIIVDYPFTTAGDSSPSIVDPGVTTSFDPSNLSFIRIQDDGFGVVLQAYQTSGATTAAGALSNNNYFTISISANTGNTLDLTSLAFDAGPGGANANSGYFVRSSVDGFGSDLLSQNYGSSFTSPANQSIALSGLSFQGINSITFRFYTFVADPSFQSDDFRNIQLNGSVATTVPEPGTLTLVGLGAFGLVAGAIRRRRKPAA